MTERGAGKCPGGSLAQFAGGATYASPFDC